MDAKLLYGGDTHNILYFELLVHFEYYMNEEPTKISIFTTILGNENEQRWTLIFLPCYKGIIGYFQCWVGYENASSDA